MDRGYDFEIIVPSDTAYLPLVLDIALEFGKYCGFGSDSDSSHYLALAVEELAVNAMKHGNRFDKNKTVTIGFCRDALTARVYIKDQSEVRFDPIKRYRADRDEPLSNHGRGIIIVEETMDRVSYIFDKGNVAIIEKKLTFADHRNLR